MYQVFKPTILNSHSLWLMESQSKSTAKPQSLRQAPVHCDSISKLPVITSRCKSTCDQQIAHGSFNHSQNIIVEKSRIRSIEVPELPGMLIEKGNAASRRSDSQPSVGILGKNIQIALLKAVWIRRVIVVSHQCARFEGIAIDLRRG